MNRIIDLTYEIEEGMPVFEAYWHPSVSIKKMGCISTEGRETKELCLGSHTGTHVDAPMHFIKDASSIADIPLEKLIGDVTIVDFTSMADNQPVTEEILRPFSLSSRVILKFGWGKYWRTKRYFSDYPYLSESAARYLISNGVDVLAMDTPSPDNSRNKFGTDNDSPVHKLLLKNEIVLVEYLANLEQVENLEGWSISIMPLKIKGSDGSPARVVIFK